MKLGQLVLQLTATLCQQLLLIAVLLNPLLRTTQLSQDCPLLWTTQLSKALLLLRTVLLLLLEILLLLHNKMGQQLLPVKLKFNAKHHIHLRAINRADSRLCSSLYSERRVTHIRVQLFLRPPLHLQSTAGRVIPRCMEPQALVTYWLREA